MMKDNRQMAYYTVKIALQNGDLIRPCRCQECGKDCFPDAHHEDYSKPLDIMWLCDSCHSRKNPNSFKPLMPMYYEFSQTKDFFRNEQRKCPVSSAPEPEKNSAPRRQKRDVPRRWSGTVLDSPMITRGKERAALYERLKAAGWLPEE